MVSGAKRLLDFVKTVFGASEIENMSTPDGRVMHAEERIGDSTMMIADVQGHLEPTTAGLYVYVPNVDATYKTALAAGATSSMAQKR
jgi:PhnB protein